MTGNALHWVDLRAATYRGIDFDRWESDPATRDWLADSLLRDVAGFYDKRTASTQVSPRQFPPGVRAWLRRMKATSITCELPSGSSVVMSDQRWAACVLAHVVTTQPKVLSFAFWMITSTRSRVCGGANLDLTDEDDPFWGFWIQ